MKLIIVSIYDSKAGFFGQPVSTVAKGAALRSFQDEVNTDGSTYARHPEDFSLFEIGTFNQDTGMIEPLKAPLQIATALELVVPKENQPGQVPMFHKEQAN